MKKRVTNHSLLLLFLTLVTGTAWSQTVTTPRTPSPAAFVSQTVGLSQVSVKYSRPSIKNRAVWGGLVPYGWNVQQFGTANPAPWRGGANENTVIEFSHPATVEGQVVPAGKYGLFFVVNQDNSGEVILSKDYTAWGNFFYDPAHDLMRAKIQLKEHPQTEMLTYEFTGNTKNSTELDLNWEKKQFPVKIEFAVDEIVMANAQNELNGQLGFSWQAYNSAANYAINNNTHLDDAAKWVEQALTRGGNNFPSLNLKAALLRKSGKTEEADKVQKDAVAIANEVELNAYGYQLLGQGKHDDAIAMLALNTQRNPKSANAWDSLGEAYAMKGDKKNAIINFKKSLALNPTAATKANSEKYLKDLAAK